MCFKGTHTLSNKAQALAESMNMTIWVNGALTQLSIRGSILILKLNFQKNNCDKILFFVIGLFCIPLHRFNLS